MFKSYFILWFCVIFGCELKAQEYRVTLKGLQKSIKYVQTDAYGAFYVVQDDNSVLKFNTEGNLLATYSDPRWGDLTLDIISPMQIGLYYKNFKKYVILNSKLALMQEFDFNNVQDFNAKNVIQSSDKNGFWIIDEYTNRIRKTNLQGFTMSAINNTPNETIEHFFTHNGNYYIFTANSIYEYDKFWQQINSFETFDKPYSFIYQDKAIGKKGNNYFSFDLLSGEQSQLALPFELSQSSQCFFHKDYIFVVDGTEIKVYN